MEKLTKEHEELLKTMESNAKIEADKRKLSIYMSCVPLPTKSAFVEWSDKNFNGNYGFALKYLWDVYRGDVNVISPELLARIEAMEADVSKLKKAEKEEVKSLRAADGSVLQ